LQHVRRIDSTLEAPIESESHHGAQPVAIERKQRVDRHLIARRGTLKQFSGAALFAAHDRPPTCLSAEKHLLSTAKDRAFTFLEPQSMIAHCSREFNVGWAKIKGDIVIKLRDAAAAGLLDLHEAYETSLLKVRSAIMTTLRRNSCARVRVVTPQNQAF
jgi:hypothetical protein